MAVLEDFEAYEGSGDYQATPNRYDGKTGDGWGISTAGTFDQRPMIRGYTDLTNFFTPAPAGGGDKGLWFQPFASGNVVTVDYDPCSGLGLWLFQNYNTTAAVDANPVAISWASETLAGGINVAVNNGDLVVVQWYDDGDYDEVTSTTPAPTTPLDEDPVWCGAWMDIGLRRGDGWWVRDLEGGTYLAASYPWTIPAGSLSWSLSCEQENSSNRTMVDTIYGYPGSNSRPAVRMFPRDDGRGMSSAPRIHPAPKSGRIIGGYQ
jgi:hypothetical protein